MAKVSIIIPSRNEVHTVATGETVLVRMVKDILEKATGDFEIIVGFDGLPFQDLPRDPRISTIAEIAPIGLKAMLNKLAQAATGQYLFKLDSHCMVGEGFDEILQADMENNWVVTPRFYVLDAKRWKWQDARFYDYFYLSCPFTDPKGLRFKAGGHWPEKTQERLDTLIDETPQMHGSGWFVNRDYFLNQIGGFPTDDPFGHAQEPINLSLKNWLKGNRMMVNKKTWYAHMHQNSNQRGYTESRGHTERTYNNVADYWLMNKEPNLIHNFEWFIGEKFTDMPTWPKNSLELIKKYQEDHS